MRAFHRLKFLLVPEKCHAGCHDIFLSVEIVGRDIRVKSVLGFGRVLGRSAVVALVPSFGKLETFLGAVEVDIGCESTRLVWEPVAVFIDAPRATPTRIALNAFSMKQRSVQRSTKGRLPAEQ